MPKRLTVLAYGLFGFALVLAGVAVGGALLFGLDRETLWSNYLITNTVIGLSAAPCGLLIARAKPGNPITSSIFNKLNVATRTEAAILARDRGLGLTSR